MYVHLFTSNMQHIKLLNGMHEGVLIINKDDKSAIFCNRSAQKLVSTYLGPLSKESNAIQETKAFIPIKIAQE